VHRPCTPNPNPIQRIAVYGRHYAVTLADVSLLIIYLLLKSCKNRPVCASNVAYWAFINADTPYHSIGVAVSAMPICCIGVSAIYGRRLFIYLLFNSWKHTLPAYWSFTARRRIGIKGRYDDTPYRPADMLTQMPTNNFLGDRLLNGWPYPVRPLSVCPVVSVTLVYCGHTVGWIQMKLRIEVGLWPGHIVLDGKPAPFPSKGHCPQFSTMSGVTKREKTCLHSRPTRMQNFTPLAFPPLRNT